MKTVWRTDDRQGAKWFSKRPRYVAGHDIFTGERIVEPKHRSRVRVIKRFNAEVEGDRSAGYPSKFKVEPWEYARNK